MRIPEYLSSNFKIIRLDGTTYDMRECGILVKSFIVDSPSPVHSRETIEGRDGFIDMGTTYDGRTAHAELQLMSVDIPDFALFRDEVFRMFDSREYFYLICDAEPGKRWRFKYDSKYSIEQKAKSGTFSIDFISDSAYAESVGRTDTDPVDMDSDAWQAVGGGLVMDEDLIYKRSQRSFRIYNGGDAIVDPRMHELIIQFKGASIGLQIKNTTTGETFKYNKSTAAGDILTINGPRVLLNGVSSLKNSNRQLLRLLPGWNSIQISGTSGSFTITFGFRWLYL